MSDNPETINNVEAKAFNPFQNFIGSGECCKKAVGGILTLIGRDFIELTSDHSFEVLTFIPGVAAPFRERVRVIIIPLERVCSVERPCPHKKHDDSC